MSAHDMLLAAAGVPSGVKATDVFSTVLWAGNAATNRSIAGIGFAPDVVLGAARNDAQTTPAFAARAINNGSTMCLGAVGQEQWGFGFVSAFGTDGFTLPTADYFNRSGANYVAWCFKKYPGFFDLVLDRGTSAAHTVAHNLTVAPELLIRKDRSGSYGWYAWHKSFSSGQSVQLNSTALIGKEMVWDSTIPTSSSFSLGASYISHGNYADHNYVTLLFASLPGVSKVGSYTGNGTTQNIDCGFTAGARFLLVFAVNNRSVRCIYDSSRGIADGNEAFIPLNTMDGDGTSDDLVDPYATGFAVNRGAVGAGYSPNVSGYNYIYLAVA